MERTVVMARKRFSDEDVIRLLRQIEVELASGATVATACRSAGVSDATYYGWRKKFGGMGPSKVKQMKVLQMKVLEKEKQRLRKAVSDLTLDKLILKESLDYLKPQ
jgi:hypothetical protein